MSSLADRTLTGEALARRLLDFRSVIVRKHHNLHRNQLSFEDVDDLYGRAVLVLLEKDPPAVFPNDRALRTWLEETMRRSIIKYAQSAAGRATQTAAPIDELGVAPTASDHFKWSVRQGVAAAQLASADFTPEQRALLELEHDTIEEYIAGLSGTDQRIALLYLWPSSRMPARKIAATLGLPVSEVQLTTQRIAMSWQRYTALSVGTVCRKQMKHLERWRRDGGQMPLQLLIHARRCSRCRQAILSARQRGYEALLPFAPTAGLFGTAGAGVLAKLASAAGGAVRKVARAVAKLIPASKEGAGSAVLAGKGAATAAIAATATVSVATVSIVAVTTGHPHVAHRPAPKAAAVTVTQTVAAAPSSVTRGSGVTAAGSPNSSTTTSTPPVAVSPTGGVRGARDRAPGVAANPTVTATTSSETASKPARAASPTAVVGSAGTDSSPAAPDQRGGEDSPTGKTLAAP